MSGVLIALLSGIGFGLFQTINRRTLQVMEVYLSTFILMVVSTIVLAAIAVLIEDLRLLRVAPWRALLTFGVAGFIHFFAGWTLLNASQKRVGASRTTLLIGTIPLFGTIIAAAALREVPSAPAMLGILLVVFGVYFLSVEPPGTAGGRSGRNSEEWTPVMGWRGLIFGLGAALCWSVSPIFIRQGLRDLPSPLLGILVGLMPCVVAYGVLMLVRRRRISGVISRGVLGLKIAAGALIGLSLWGLWEALDRAPVGVVLGIMQVTVLVVIALSPFVVGRHLERVTSRVWGGSLVIVSGTLLLIWSR